MKLAYLTNEYPKPSHTFIRREIAGIEVAGLQIERISVRPAREHLVDEQDREERKRTRVILGRGALGLLPSAIAVTASHPVRMLRAVRTAIRIGWRSPRGVLRHLAYLAEACVLLRWADRMEVEHVHAHFSTNPTAVALLCRDLGGPPFSFTAHGNADFAPAAANALSRKIAKAAFVVAVCEDGRRRLLQRTPAGQEHKLHVVHCGVDAPYLAATATAVPDTARLVCVARLSSEKGIDVLLRAARRLLDDGIEFEIALLGDGPQRSALEGLACELGLAARVRFEGWKSGDEVRTRLQESRALVLASLTEGLPVAIMEALALRRPVICSAVGGVAELVTPGVCGWLVAPGSENQLAEAMRSALTCPVSELESMGRRGALRVAAMHDALAEAHTMTELFLASADESRAAQRMP